MQNNGKIRIHGMCIIMPDDKAVMPNSEFEFISACKKVGIELSVKSDIIRTLTYMYGYDVFNAQNLKGQNDQPLYRELEHVIQNMPEYVEMKKKMEKVRKERAQKREENKETIIKAYVYERDFKRKKKDIFRKMKKEHRYHRKQG